MYSFYYHSSLGYINNQTHYIKSIHVSSHVQCNTIVVYTYSGFGRTGTTKVNDRTRGSWGLSLPVARSIPSATGTKLNTLPSPSPPILPPNVKSPIVSARRLLLLLGASS